MAKSKPYEDMIGVRGERPPALSVAGLPYQQVKGTVNLGGRRYCVLDHRLSPEDEIAHLRALQEHVARLDKSGKSKPQEIEVDEP